MVQQASVFAHAAPKNMCYHAPSNVCRHATLTDAKQSPGLKAHGSRPQERNLRLLGLRALQAIP